MALPGLNAEQHTPLCVRDTHACKSLSLVAVGSLTMEDRICVVFRNTLCGKNQHLTRTKMTFYMSSLVIHKTDLIKIGIHLLAFVFALKHFITRNRIPGL